MLKKVVFRLDDDVIACGVNTENNFLNTEDYISGAVVRAGFAKQIFLECSLDKRENEFSIEIKDEELCAKCEKYNICKSFSYMKFSFLYKLDCIPSPLTAKKCKINSKAHPIKDIMCGSAGVECEECKKVNPKAGRMEDAKGYINIRDMKVEKVDKNSTTHTAINYNTRTALDGSLYSTRSIARGQYFYGYIDDCGTGLVDKDAVVYVGKYSSNGFGKLRITEIYDADKPKDLKKMISDFTTLYTDREKSDDKYYIPLLLLSDARLGIAERIDAQTTDAQTTGRYKQKWKQFVFGNESVFEIEKVYAQNRIYRGFDTRRKWGDWEKRPVIHTVKGSSFLISVDKAQIEDAIKELKNMLDNGIGTDTADGYGRVDVCNEVHMMGVK